MSKHSCTWDSQADCPSCGLQSQLHCKWDGKLLLGFYGIALPPLLIIILGMVFVGLQTGQWWLLYGYVIYFMAMFCIGEIRFLCSHCPYYAEEGKILHCLANHGCYKLWSYHPEPMSKLEKGLFYFLIASSFFILPLAVMGYGLYSLALHYTPRDALTLASLIIISVLILVCSLSLVLNLKIFFCPYCPNFSCPFNSVPKKVIDAYLRQNPEMRQAWETAGWQLEAQ